MGDRVSRIEAPGAWFISPCVLPPTLVVFSRDDSLGLTKSCASVIV
jgi:hypothetical protein